MASITQRLLMEVREFRFGSRTGSRRAYLLIEEDYVRVLYIRLAAQTDIHPEELLNDDA